MCGSALGFEQAPGEGFLDLLGSGGVERLDLRFDRRDVDRRASAEFFDCANQLWAQPRGMLEKTVVRAFAKGHVKHDVGITLLEALTESFNADGKDRGHAGGSQGQADIG